MVLVKPLQHANVRQAERAAPFEHQADLCPVLLLGFLSRLSILRLKRDTYQESKQEEQGSRSPETSLRAASNLFMSAWCWIHQKSIIAHNGRPGKYHSWST
jgi:hypothetical protein